MSIGKRINFFRNKRQMTQKQLGIMIGFPERSADIRMAQYEAGTRTPKADVADKLAKALDVSPRALNTPEIDDPIGLMHTLFALEDMYGIQIGEIDGEVCLRISREHSSHNSTALLLQNWNRVQNERNNGSISEEEYEAWKYHYPQSDTIKFLKDKLEQRIIKKELSD